MNKKISIITAILFLIPFLGINAQEMDNEDALVDSILYTPEFLDTVVIDTKLHLNDYSMIGFEYGASYNRMSLNPAYDQESFLIPEYYGITYTRYGKMFGYMPYFGFQIGVMYGHQGYKFKKNELTGNITTLEGASQAIYDIIEVPFLAQLHLDARHFKVMASVGPYYGYRLRIERIGDNVDPSIVNKFMEYDKRHDYGLQGGLGIGLVFSPIEFHINAKLRYSWQNIYQPDYWSKYSYRFAYPFDFMVTAGIHFQLTRRTGKSKATIKREAKRYVYENPESQNR